MRRDLTDVLEAILAGVVVVGPAGRVEELNSVACRLLGRSRETSLGCAIDELVPPGHEIARLARSVLSRGSAISAADCELEPQRGERVPIDVSASPLQAESGETQGAVVVLRDRSAHRRLEQLESERERFEAFGRIAAGLAHEVKNPLGGIRGAGEILAQRASDAKTKETAGLIVREATRIAALVDDFMVFARRDKLRLAHTNIHRVLDGVLALLSHDPLGEAVEIERAYDPSIPELAADADRLIQVFLNLLRNSLQAMEGRGGSLTVTTRMTLDHRIALDDGKPLPTLAVSIRDTGRGMTPDELRQATTPFFSARQGGTGLGLALADYWVAQHRGTLHLESELGVGTTARVSLPLRKAP
ncbi:MAG TPA: ATP-binding protein [Myxococcota bacterium]|jgi:two-component system nitrogen regulation sensor histidine kinase GlnL